MTQSTQEGVPSALITNDSKTVPQVELDRNVDSRPSSHNPVPTNIDAVSGQSPSFELPPLEVRSGNDSSSPPTSAQLLNALKSARNNRYYSNNIADSGQILFSGLPPLEVSSGNNSGPPSTSAQPLNAPKSARSTSRCRSDKTFELIADRISGLEDQLESQTDFIESGFHNICAHIHELSDERKKADTVAKKARDAINRRVINLIDMSIEDNSLATERAEAQTKTLAKIDRRVRARITASSEDHEELTEKLEAAAKLQEDMSRRITNTIDLIIEDLPEILAEGGLLCRCSASEPASPKGSPKNESRLPAHNAKSSAASPIDETDDWAGVWSAGSSDLFPRHRNDSLPARRRGLGLSQGTLRGSAALHPLAANSPPGPHGAGCGRNDKPGGGESRARKFEHASCVDEDE